MTFIIAEMSGNHNGELARAVELIRQAKKCGCDAVKFQLYTADDLGDAFDATSNFCVPVDWVPQLFEAAYKAGIPLFASIFHPTAVGVLHPFNPFAYKIASPESTLLKPEIYTQIARAVHNEYAKLFVSSGANTMDWAGSLGPDLIFYCKQGYPAKLDYKDLRYLQAMMAFSDHTAGFIETLAVLKVGVETIEKHFMLESGCVDEAFSLDPYQMRWLVDICKGRGRDEVGTYNGR